MSIFNYLRLGYYELYELDFYYIGSAKDINRCLLEGTLYQYDGYIMNKIEFL